MKHKKIIKSYLRGKLKENQAVISLLAISPAISRTTENYKEKDLKNSRIKNGKSEIVQVLVKNPENLVKKAKIVKNQNTCKTIAGNKATPQTSDNDEQKCREQSITKYSEKYGTSGKKRIQLEAKMANLKMKFESKNELKNSIEGERVLVITKVNGTKKFENISPFWIKKVVDNAAGGAVNQARKNRDGKIIVNTKNKQQAAKLIKLSQINEDNKVVVTEDGKANQSEGVIFCRDLKYATDEEILDELAEQKVINIRRAKKKNELGLEYETGLYFVTFDSRELPEQLRVGYEMLEVRPFIPEPMRCFRCMKFGHTQKFCKKPEEGGKICGNCSEKEHVNRAKGEKCNASPKCTNCGSEDHGNFSRQCPVYIMEKEICSIKTRKKITYGMARKEYMIANPLHKRTYATTVKEPKPVGIKDKPPNRDKRDMLNNWVTSSEEDETKQLNVKLKRNAPTPTNSDKEFMKPKQKK